MPQPIRFGRYRLTQRIAIGGMAEVFLAEADGPMGFVKQVVIKRILPQHSGDTEFVRMFVTEAKLVAQLVHPNIVQVYELGQVDNQYYIAMERVDGIDLRQLWNALARDRQRLPSALALYITAELLQGLEHAHRAVGHDGQPLGVVHRDVSPSNVLISWRGDVKLADFGIALVRSQERGSARLFKGKNEYMSPEQLSGGAIDQRADIFSAGVILTELLLGRHLFHGSSELERLERAANAQIDIFERHAAAFTPCTGQLVRHALRRDPGLRFRSAMDFRRAVLSCALSSAETEPIDAEVLASFITEHIVPRLSPAELSSGPGGPFPQGQAGQAVFASRIVPDDAELTPPPVDEPEFPLGI